MRTNTQNGGGLGNSYTFGAPIIPGVDAGQTVVPQSSCMATTPPGFIANPRMGAGLPGMGGGGQKTVSFDNNIKVVEIDAKIKDGFFYSGNILCTHHCWDFYFT